MMYTVMLLALGTLMVLAGCADVSTTPVPTPTAESGHASSPGQGIVVVELAMSHAPRLNETAVLTCTVKPYWELFAQYDDLDAKGVRAWIELPPGLEVEQMPPEVTPVTAGDLPWNCWGCVGALYKEETLEYGDALQFAVSVKFVQEEAFEGGPTSIGAVAWLLRGEEFEASSVTYLELTVMGDYSHFGYPEGWWDRPGQAEQTEPGDGMPVTLVPGLLQEDGETPEPAPSPPTHEAPPRPTDEPSSTDEPPPRPSSTPEV